MLTFHATAGVVSQKGTLLVSGCLCQALASSFSDAFVTGVSGQTTQNCQLVSQNLKVLYQVRSGDSGGLITCRSLLVPLLVILKPVPPVSSDSLFPYFVSVLGNIRQVTQATSAARAHVPR